MQIDTVHYQQQVREAFDLMLRHRAYAERIGCVTYAYGAMHDSIECTEAQSRQLAEWWAANTRYHETLNPTDRQLSPPSR